MPSPSLPVADNNNFTLFIDGSDQFHKVDNENAGYGACPEFSVESDVIFELFTHKNPTEPQILDVNDYTTVKKSNFNWLHPTRILIHGWNSEGLLTARFADAYLIKGKHKVNFIAVNWQKGSDVYNYYCARGHVNEIAEHVARFVDFMSEKAWLKITDLNLIGHSLGAHISGIGEFKENEKNYLFPFKLTNVHFIDYEFGFCSWKKNNQR